MNPVTYSSSSQAVISTYNAKPKDQKMASYWSDDAVAAVKKEIKDHYIQEQNFRCAYCRQPMYTEHNGVWDAEHVISKKTKPEFMFEPRNLAISCKDCNQAKSDQEVRKNHSKVSFPTTSPEYIIVHPHFDTYEDHIRWMGPVCVALSKDKGSKTIAMCNLTRIAALRLKDVPNVTDNDFNDLMGRLIEAKTSQQSEVAVAGVLALLKAKLK